MTGFVVRIIQRFSSVASAEQKRNSGGYIAPN